jgi:isopentenyl-diphosphate delta-isomerase
MEQVTLVDERDSAIGAEEKMRAHLDGKLHRAFSIFVFNSEQELLLQRRAHAKYHSGGLWSNTCCGHPRPHETVTAAAKRRLREEMGFVCGLEESFGFLYRAELDHELIEHEFDHVLVGQFDGEPHPDPAEVCEFQWLSLDRLRRALATTPESFTYWLKVALEKKNWDLRVSGCNGPFANLTTGGMGSGC